MNFINLSNWTIFPNTIAFINWDTIDPGDDDAPVAVIWLSSHAGDGIFEQKLIFRKDEEDYKKLATYFGRS